MVSCPLESVIPKLRREASTYPQQTQESPSVSWGNEAANKTPSGPAGKSSGWKEAWVEWSWPGRGGGGQRIFPKGPQEGTCPLACGLPPCYIIFFLYKWIHSLLAVTVQVPQNLGVSVSS